MSDAPRWAFRIQVRVGPEPFKLSQWQPQADSELHCQSWAGTTSSSSNNSMYYRRSVVRLGLGVAVTVVVQLELQVELEVEVQVVTELPRQTLPRAPGAESPALESR